MQKLKPYYRNKFGVGLYSWRDLELSQMVGNSGRGKLGVIGWNLCHSGSCKKLKTGQEAIKFPSLTEAEEYLRKEYNLSIDF